MIEAARNNPLADTAYVIVGREPRQSRVESEYAEGLRTHSTAIHGHRKRLRLLIVEPSGLLWGSERALLDLIKHVDSSRYEILVACPTSARLTPHLTALGVRVVEGDIGMLHRRGRLSQVRAFLWLAMIIRRENPDVIHVNEAGMTALVAAARIGARPPLVTHVRLWDDAVILAHRLPRLASQQLVIAISEFIAAELRSRASAPSKRGLADCPIRVVYDPFDSDTFLRETDKSDGLVKKELGLSGTDRIVLMVGRVCREKGQDLLLDAAELLGDMGIVFLFVGGVPPDSPVETAYRDSLLQRAAGPRLRERVKFLGNRDDIARLMKASDVVVVASANEPFGRVILEALSLGKPVVAPDRGGPTEIIGDNLRGYLFKACDPKSLSESIREVLSSPASASERATLGKAWVHAECSPQAHSARIQALWEEVWAEGSSRA